MQSLFRTVLPEYLPRWKPQVCWTISETVYQKHESWGIECHGPRAGFLWPVLQEMEGVPFLAFFGGYRGGASRESLCTVGLLQKASVVLVPKARPPGPGVSLLTA